MNNERQYTILVTAEDLKVIGDALSALPYIKVVGLLSRLQLQINEQEKAAVQQVNGRAPEVQFISGPKNDQ